MSGTGSGPGAVTPLDAVVTAAAAVVWYALPDHVAERRRRALVKVGLLGALAGWSALHHPPSTAPSAADTARAERAAALGDREPTRAEVWRGAALGVAAVLALVASTALTVAVERGVHRFGERSARRGVRLPHTRNGVVLGALSAAGTLGLERVLRRWAPDQPPRAEDAPPA